MLVPLNKGPAQPRSAARAPRAVLSSGADAPPREAPRAQRAAAKGCWQRQRPEGAWEGGEVGALTPRHGYKTW